jgi:hypothetical protein
VLVLEPEPEPEVGQLPGDATHEMLPDDETGVDP